MHPSSSTRARLLCRWACAALSSLVLAAPAIAEAQMLKIPTRVFLNGVPTPVSFNDGDSFLVLGGRHNGTRARLAGFNTLESYGNVHQWGGWKKKELYNLAKLATMNARAGVWRCESEDLKRDGYGRVLWWCKDLAVDQVRRGLAHAMTVTLEGANPEVLAAQAEAIRERRGMWAHGVPEYVLTSLHSVNEGGGFSGRTYNRLVSTKDGHSAKWFHDEAYGECSTVCSSERSVDAAQVEAGVAGLRADPAVSSIVAALKTEQLRNLVGDYARLGFFWGIREDDEATKVRAALERLEDAGVFGDADMEEGSCVVYVEFNRRYGQGRAACL